MGGFFERTFDGSQPADEVLAFLRGESRTANKPESYPGDVISRIQWKQPFPLLRHHFGLPTLEASLDGVAKIAEARALDVISLGIDQDAQENFFHPERQNPRAKGAGGVPVRSAQDYRDLFAASRRGNFPLMRTYSGTDDFIRLAEMYTETIHNAWCAIPLFWFNQMDGRGPIPLEESIHEHQQVMAWYGSRGIPVELNEPHHWGMRDASDVVYTAAGYLSALNAKHMGVRDYIAQMMFNSPAGLSDAMDLAKMLAILELTAPLEDETFHVWRQTRTGLLSYPLDEDAARAHLATSIYVQMALKPHIVHIVGHTEADHAATAEDVIAASRMARQAIENALRGQPDMTADPAILRRRDHLVAQTKITLQAMCNLGDGTAADLTNPTVLGYAVREGILDAPQLKNNRFAPGRVHTRIMNGACESVDGNGHVLSEQQRLQKYL